MGSTPPRPPTDLTIRMLPSHLHLLSGNMVLGLFGEDLLSTLAEIVAKRRQLLSFALTCKTFSVGADRYRENFTHMYRAHCIARPLEGAPLLPESDEPRIPELRDAYMQSLAFAFDHYCSNRWGHTRDFFCEMVTTTMQGLSMDEVSQVFEAAATSHRLDEMAKMTITREELIDTILHAVQWQRGECNAAPIPQALASGCVVSHMVEQVLDFIVGSDDAIDAERSRTAVLAALSVMDSVAEAARRVAPDSPRLARSQILALTNLLALTRAAALAAFNDVANDSDDSDDP